ncbi:unnamed protein product [Lymnaea stagnalis]|uniref:non-specific serine/threonine protein kinase n=1 Tax=Lymnaea stagnalis TaxID=6523 RepID=A0AAV2HI45_LYMST
MSKNSPRRGSSISLTKSVSRDASPTKSPTREVSPSKSTKSPAMEVSKSTKSPTREVSPSKSTKSPAREVSKSTKSPTREVSPSKSTKSSAQLSPTAPRKATAKATPSPERVKTGSTMKSARRQSLSPPKSTVSSRKRSPIASVPPSGGSRDLSAKEDKQKRPVTAEPSNVTESGLKIVDWSGQGLTSLPSNLIHTKDVGHLIVSSNNMRALPPEIKLMNTLEKLDLSRNGIRCTSSTDFSGLPQEMAQLTNLTELCLSECNLAFVPPAVFKITCLKVLNLSRNKVNILLPDIGQLTNLVLLNVQQTNITSLPPEIAYCQELEELYLWGNSIETLPETLSEMPKLRVLALNYRSFCGVVDPYMENLLKKGQIKSEHIPAVVFELPALQVLDLENTKLNTLPQVSNVQLQELYLGQNFLQAIPPSIYNLKLLGILDMSNNLLTELPSEIGQLTGLRVLRLAHNSIDQIPPNIGRLHQLEELDLARNRIKKLPPEMKDLKVLKILILDKNKIQRLPEEICDLTHLHTLDLTGNEIRSLPMAMHRLTGLTEAHTYNKLTKSGLWLYQNPLERPPPEVWRTDKPEHIFEYLKKLMILTTENLQTQKIQLLGASQCGKSSLCQALSLGKSQVKDGTTEKTRLFQQTLWKTENNVEFVLYDFGGDDVYSMLYKIFLDNKSLVMLVYNAATMHESNFYSSVGQWLDMLSSCLPGAIVKIVGTQVDLLQTEDTPKEFLQPDDDDVKTGTSSENELKILSAPSEDSKNIDVEEDDLFSIGPEGDEDVQRNTSTPAAPEPPHNQVVQELVTLHLSKREQQFKDELTKIEDDIAKLEKSGQTQLTDMDESVLKLLRVRQQKIKSILQNPLKILPGISCVSSSESLEGILPLINELEHLAIDQTLFPHAQRHIPGHWKRLGNMLKQGKGFYLYWDDVEQMAQRFSVKGDELQECVKYLHDTANVLWFHNDLALSQMVFHKPILLSDLISSLFRHDMRDFLQYENKVFLSKGRLNRRQFEECAHRLLHMGEISRPLLNSLWFHLDLSNNDIDYLLELLPLFDICYAVPEPEVPTGPIYNRPLLVVPWYNKDTDMSPLSEVWPNKTHHKELAVIYTFPFFCPLEILPNISAQIQDFVDERLDWEDHIYASCDSEQLLLRRSIQDGIHRLTIIVRGIEFALVQELMEDLVDLVNTYLHNYSGLYWKLTIPMGASSIPLVTLTDVGGSAKGYGGGRRGSRMIKPISNK